MATPFIDLTSQYLRNKKNFDSAVLRVLAHGQYIQGPEVRELESKLADYIGVKHALAVSSGTDALVLPLMTKNLSASDAIFTTPFTFFASAESISLAGATPVFVDIDPLTYNIDPVDLKAKIESTLAGGKLAPRGIIPVDLFGLAADYKVINDIATKYDLFVLEDAAQSFGAKYHDNKAGGLASVAATSFYPAKPLGCYGDGGAVFTNDTNLFDELVSLRVHGQATSGDKYDNIRIGMNARMDTIQAAVLLEKLKLYDNELQERSRVAASYTAKLKGALITPTIPSNQNSVWAQYSVQSPQRDLIRKKLGDQGIPTAIFYPIPIHLSTAYKHLGYNHGDFPVSEATAQQIFSLPMHPYLAEKEIQQICKLVVSVIDDASGSSA